MFAPQVILQSHYYRDDDKINVRLGYQAKNPVLPTARHLGDLLLAC